MTEFDDIGTRLIAADIAASSERLDGNPITVDDRAQLEDALLDPLSDMLGTAFAAGEALGLLAAENPLGALELLGGEAAARVSLGSEEVDKLLAYADELNELDSKGEL